MGITLPLVNSVQSSDKTEGSSIHPEVWLGGALAIFAQMYLWGNVFVTLFKKPQQPPAPQLPTEDRGASPAPSVGPLPTGTGSPPATSPIAPEARSDLPHSAGINDIGSGTQA